MQNSENNKEPFEQANTTPPPEKISGHNKNEGPAPVGRKAYKETIRLFIKMLVTIFLCEAAIMVFLHFLSLKRVWNIVADPLLLTILGTPILYWLLVRPVWLALEQRNRAVAELKNERNFAEGLIKTTQAIILLLDEEGRIEHFNPYMEQISGYRLDEVKGKDWFTTFLPERDQKRIKELFCKARSGIQTQGNINPIVTKDGQECEIEWFDKVLTDTNGNVAGLLATGQDITERKKAEEAVRNIAEGVSAATGEAFFRQLVRYLARTLDADYAFVGELTGEKGDRVRTIAMCAHGEIVDNIKYDLANTPCENVVGKSICSYPRDIQSQFPHDHLLVEMGIESYVGTPLFDSEDNLLGIAVVMYSTPLSNPKLAESMLQIFGIRASAELQRKRAEEALRESEEEYRSIFETAASLITSVNEKGVIVECNNRVKEVLGY